MISFDKLKKEILRIFRKPIGLPMVFFTYVFGARYYDMFLASQRTVLNGELPQSNRHVVYLIYPHLGLQQSHLITLEYLKSKGFSTTVVSNHTLTESEVKSILPNCSAYINRVNFGHDFGGYRDGILSLKSSIQNLDQLILLNDSVWFPVTDKSDWIDDVTSLNVDFGAATSNFGFPRLDPEQYMSLDFDYKTSRKRFHYCSFALALGPNAFKRADFWRFWSGFPLATNKRLTVKRGEIGLTAWALKAGLTHGSTLPIAELNQLLDQLDLAELEKIAKHLIILEDRRMLAVKKQVLEGTSSSDKRQLIQLILMAVVREGAAYALAYHNIFKQGFPFLKKSPVWLNEEAANITMQLLNGIEERRNTILVEEMVAINRAYKKE